MSLIQICPVVHETHRDIRNNMASLPLLVVHNNYYGFTTQIEGGRGKVRKKTKQVQMI